MIVSFFILKNNELTDMIDTTLKC